MDPWGTPQRIDSKLDSTTLHVTIYFYFPDNFWTGYHDCWNSCDKTQIEYCCHTAENTFLALEIDQV